MSLPPSNSHDTDAGAHRRALVVYVDRPPHLIHQARALYQSLLYSCAPDTDLFCFGPQEALDLMPNDVQIIKHRQEPHPLAPQYGFINSIACLNGPGHELLDGYAYLLKTDVDTFLTPAWNQFRPMHFSCGVGGYVHTQNTRERLLRLSQQFGYVHRGQHNLGSTLWGPPALIKSVCKLATELTEHLIQVEFRHDKGAWPDWFWGVSSMYATEIALNHLVPDLQEPNKNLDHSSSVRQPITEHPHIHCWHTDQDYNKFKWMAGGYASCTEEKLDLDMIPDYCLAMALRAQSG